MEYIILYVVQLSFKAYIVLLFARVIGSWFPALAHYKIMRFVAHYTDPYLNLFRRIIPPIGGVLDLSPLLAFFALGILERVIIRILLFLF